MILLEQNYRSTQVVLDTARAIIDKNKHRTPKALFTDRSGGSLVTVQEAYSEQEEGEWIAHRSRNCAASAKATTLTSPSCTAPMPSRARWKRRSSARGCPTGWLAASASIAGAK